MGCSQRGRLNDAERAFLAASIEQEQHEALEREAQRHARAGGGPEAGGGEQAQRAEEQALAAQQLRRRALLLGAALLLAVLLAGTALVLGRQAAANAGTAEAERQVALAREERPLRSAAWLPILSAASCWPCRR